MSGPIVRCPVCGESYGANSLLVDVPDDAPRGQFLYTRAEVLAFGEKVREACAKAAESQVSVGTSYDVLGMVRAVDVARLLEEDK